MRRLLVSTGLVASLIGAQDARAEVFTGNMMLDSCSMAVRVVVKYLKSVPERLHLWDGLLVSEALVTAWPCAAKKSD